MAHPGGILGLGALALIFTLPAHAGGKFAAPAGCEVYATVQMRECQVSQHYRCAHDAPGDQWATYLDGEGPYYSSRIDAETRWLESYDLYSGETDRLMSEVDPASFTTLITTGRDDYDFTTESNSGNVVRYSGHDRLTGEKVVIDGVTLERTKFDLTARNAAGEVLWTRKGQQLIHRDWRIFFADRETFENTAGESSESVSTPVVFALPGEKGFLSADPQYDCNMTMTEAVLPGEGIRP
ncbi:hypothetical protein OEZ71_16940 [Defluviimonas sp. WL0050]|uniref:Uncharacterized protein n=1 Tax=Albidovulum litorale TaxID=2984134 RepID=A0ABT2ZS51_9RHOB|nr:hypothetical protein [Defluviimonas sp. WL0050]MCV2873984.1 hypothetical protein [Defluviimonas sp. WL0050]